MALILPDARQVSLLWGHGPTCIWGTEDEGGVLPWGVGVGGI